MTCNSDCPICFETIECNVNRIITECGHEFHCSCLMKSVTANNFGCPLCRSALAEEPEEEEEEDEEEDNGDHDELNSYNENYSDDIRFDSDLTESHLLRGFRWLFVQQRTEEPEVVPSIFDGNSFSITRNSIRNAPPTSDTEPIDEAEEEEEEQEWKECEKRTRKVQKFSNELVNDILLKRIPYEKLLSAYLCSRFPDLFDFIEFQRDDDKIFSILEEKVTILANEIQEDEDREVV